MMIETALDFKLKNTGTGKEFKLGKNIYSIGREQCCDIQLEFGNPSRMHAQIIYKNGTLLLDDLNSKNGTFVNDKRINNTTPIRPGDVIRFSTNEFTLLSNDPKADTIISKKASFAVKSHSFIVDEEIKVEPDETALQLEYPLPVGWRIDDTNSKELFRSKSSSSVDDKLDQKIKKTLSKDETVYIGALIFNPYDSKPSIFGLSVDSQQHYLSIGRSNKCTFTINAPSVSEHHANLRFRQGKWHISDNKSTNGIREHKGRVSTIVLEHGTTLSLGQVKMIYRNISWAL